MKKTNNKGFSLVELIVVVAIMAVLMIVVGPQMLRYVEKTRAQDASAFEEVRHAVEIAVADENIYNKIPSTGGSVVIKDNTAFSGAPAELLTELNLIFPGSKITFSSTTYKTQQYTITITKTAGSGATVTGTWGAVTP